MTQGFVLGDVTVQRIIEEETPLFDPLTFLPTLTKDVLEENRGWMEPAALDPATGKLILCIQSWVVRTKHHTILVDTCVGNDKDRPNHPFWNRLKRDSYMRGLAALGLTVDDIDIVMCSHMHVDHVGWNTRLENGRWVPTFPRARYVFSAAEYAYWEGEHAKAASPIFADSVLPVVEAGRAEMVADDHAITDAIRLEPTPGHTPHHVALRVGSGDHEMLFTGDLIHSPIQARYPELSMRADWDGTLAAKTRRRVLDCACEARTLLCFAHFPSPARARVSRWGTGFRADVVG
ncbi:MBL fold metallo-hydrolase [Roseomonas terrae]|jgi:glyoxylase-like metal-dependent hydrolase (beta-lactamase superfamily II)|uniref:MBL fold metallo-hydrolase n=1 Tax=Neoroseomonas terrae TaxID=424799 RepID=A0ABS5EDD3_9PROT|nr:MBL fold metallo-hydrolase [Neoroseomonas terrae]MBR0649037.1 MBL fold metallo-hydrolase [Neoroseomonas terrae]